MEQIWNELYNAAKKVLNPRKVSSIIEAGGVSAAIETESGKIYVGVCVDSACSLGICAERNAIFNMITNVKKLFDFDKIIITKVTLLYSALATGYVCFLLFDKPRKKNQNVIQVIINPNTFSTYDKYKDKYMNKYNDKNDDNYY